MLRFAQHDRVRRVNCYIIAKINVTAGQWNTLTCSYIYYLQWQQAIAVFSYFWREMITERLKRGSS